MHRRRPPSLWTDRPDDWPEAGRGRRRDDEQAEPPTEALPRARPAARPVTPPRATEEPPTGDGKRSRRRTASTIALVAVLAGTAGAIGVSALGGDDAPKQAAVTSVAPPLPAAGGTVAPSSDAKLYAQASRAVVSVRVRSGSQVGSGTGFLIDRDGTIVTNSHVVGTASKVQVQLDDGRDFVEADVRGSDPSTDLAVIKLPATEVVGITPAGARRSPTTSRSGTALSRSATRSDSTAPRPPGSSPASAARSRRPTDSASTRSSRPTPRSTPATRVDPCSTPADA